MSDPSENKSSHDHSAYWRTNIRILLLLLALWFIASFGLSILAVDWLDNFQFMGFPFGFWMAQQGSIIAFLIIIAVYVIVMNRVDKRHGVDEEDANPGDFEI